MADYDFILNMLLMFFTYCIAGWIWECIYMSILEKTLLNRGFLNGPYIPIYGFGGWAVYFSLQAMNGPLRSINTVKIFFIGLFFATVLEYITSVLLERIFKARWWDYTNYKFNLNGRICLLASLFWGLVSVVFVQIINPLLLHVFGTWSHDARLIVVTFMVTLMAVDTAITLCSLINLQKRISELVEIENTKWENFITKIEAIPADYQTVLKTYKEKAYKVTNPVTKRLLSAFPEMTLLSKSRQIVFDRLKRNKIDEDTMK